MAKRKIDGVLLLDKPFGFSSTGALQKARWLFQAEKAGHTGVLDPYATGLLPLCFGEATKFSQRMLDADKGYRATIRLGEVSTTLDGEGEITQGGEVTCDETAVRAVLASFLGEYDQV
ncbi:MAG TPA: tRNA pseudouridine(55) synthase TruB, partial [Chitinolyticbacter sp.]|nr:tRNA pseudouridine(55) synthase TruB [Chitinolyticbacter sp.]